MNWPTGRSHSSPLRRAHIFLQNHSGYSLARIWPLAIASLTLAVLPDLSVAKCQVGKVVELPITMAGLVPLVPVKINGKDAKFILDSGAFYSMMSAATAAEYELKLKAAPDGLSVHGIGGFISTSVANVREFTVAGITIHDVQFLVGGSEVGSSGILGQNLLEKWDVEYDFAKGIVTLIKTDDCKNAVLAYWVAPGQSFSAMDLTRMGIRDFHTIGEGYINGMKIRVEFDTGAGASVLTLKAAARAGVKTDSPGVVDAGYGRGIGRALAKQYIAPFASFKIGDGEEIKNARLRISDVDLGDADMLLGADFFVSHHVYIANSQHKAYLTYNGGPIFDLSKLSSPDAASAAVSSADPATASDAPKKADDEPATAEALARRGAAFAARRDFEHALADLTRACELDPNNPEYLFQRGVVRWRNSQADLALADFNRVLELKPDYVPALMDRAELRIQNKDISGAKIDLDAADRSAAKQADARFELALDRSPNLRCESLVVGDEDRLRRAVMLGLREQIGRDPVRIIVAVRHHQDFRRPRDHVDANRAEDAALRRGDIGITRPGDLVDRRDRGRAISKRGDGLRATDAIDHGYARDVGRGQHQRVERAVRRRHHHHNPRDARNPRRHRVHQHRGWIRRSAAGHIDSDRH